jgi:hypothetical protein
MTFRLGIMTTSSDNVKVRLVGWRGQLNRDGLIVVAHLAQGSYPLLQPGVPT